MVNRRYFLLSVLSAFSCSTLLCARAQCVVDGVPAIGAAVSERRSHCIGDYRARNAEKQVRGQVDPSPDSPLTHFVALNSDLPKGKKGGVMLLLASVSAFNSHNIV